MSARTILAVDPGARGTGVIVRKGNQLVAYHLVERADPGLFPGAAYLREVNAVIGQLGGWRPDLLAIEDLRAPNPHLGLTNVTGALGAAMVLGAILDRWADVLLVAPGGHGSGLLLAYPAELRGPRERKGTGVRRHLRSAWDIAGAAATQIRMAQLARQARRPA
jgi:hypothetical protein